MLLDILTDIEMEVGQSDVDRSARIYRINKAAKEIHETNDLLEALDEGLFSINVDSSQIALPAYAEKMRGWRFADSSVSVDIDDIRNRYNSQYFGENEVWSYQYREKGVSTLSREIANQSVLTFSVPVDDEPSDIEITVTGRTDKSNRLSETVVLAAGELSVQTVANWVGPVESITKNIISKYNITITDVEDNELGEILNSEYQSYYKIYQIGDTEDFTLPDGISGLEVLYKKKFQPFKNDADCFLGTDRYDSAIVWKYLEHRSKKVEEAQAFLAKSNQVLTQAQENDTPSVRRKMNFKPNGYFNLPYYGSARGYRGKTEV